MKRWYQATRRHLLVVSKFESMHD